MIGPATALVDVPPERRYTEHLDNPGVCMVCGCLPERHRADASCPHTVDSLTDEQIEQWWRAGGRGGSFVDALDASPQLRRMVRNGGSGVYYPTPSMERAGAARQRIADALNTA